MLEAPASIMGGFEQQKHSQTKASPIAEDIADVKRNIDNTRDRMFIGALVNAYSRQVIMARISLNAVKT
jgi:hypothetical protein